MVRRYGRWAAALALVALAALAACGRDAVKIEDELFGDGTRDASPTVAEVDGVRITERMLEMALEDLPRTEKGRYQGDDGKRVFAKRLVDEALKAREARRRKLDLVPANARVLIAQRRLSLDAAMTNALIEGRQPTADEIRAYFEANRDRYARLGTMHASHVECASEATARAAHREASGDTPFAIVVGKYSENPATRERGGDLGWFNKGGFVPDVVDPKAFTTAVWDLERGVNPPLQVAGKWHVVKVHERQYDRPQTLEEAYDAVLRDMLPSYQSDLVEDWLAQARAGADVEYFGDYRPGKGRTARELLERAMHVADTQQKMDLYRLIVEDYPRDEAADDALFLAANEALDAWGDRPRAHNLLNHLLREHPQSEYAADAKYILENMDRPNFTKPRSIEDLRGRS